ncbi:uncharacterized protein B0H18DRAFT_952543 [Fomitopsis serialis]|uniref:uncharacterized protein n=1 Tax=Fomitopsis serialis TaxID=139415 RepID=UPI002007E2C2|nr:uncharacterized protein B0H18DRAFT_952543 [Neoantrodia serialis]KAH9931875.1 hypothetical protein B0H18DRAFT_952543 [Neoantrodia serialis]
MVDEEKEDVLKSGPIRCVAIDDSFAHLATTGDDKKLKVWQLVGLKLLSTRELPKKPTEVAFTRDGLTISCRTSLETSSGEFYPVYLKPKSPDVTQPVAGSSKRGALTSHENPSNGELILGHVSLLTSFLLTPDEKHIITADRDEHIRVSWYPKGYVIERYCLGHAKFVSAIHIPAFAPGVLISGGGDPMLKVWDGCPPYIKVKAPKRKRGWDDGDGEDGGAVENNTARKKRGRKGDAENTPGPSEGAVQADAHPDEADKTVLVIQKIRTVDLSKRGKVVQFSAVGALLLPLPEPGEESPPKVHAVDFGHPIIDFTPGAYQCTWVLLDASIGASETGTAKKQSTVSLVSWAYGSPVVVDDDDAPALLESLRTTCVLPATSADLKTLDLYSALSSMPKNVDPEHDPLRRDLLAEATPEPGAEGSAGQKELTQREQARLKKKRALAAKLAKEKGNGLTADAIERQTEIEAEAEAERERKRVKSSGETLGSAVAGPADDAMDES